MGGIMECKYENVEKVIAKKDFEVFRHDDDGELIGVVTVPKGCKGVIESMGWSSTDGFRNCYDILFTEDNNEISVGIHEEYFETLLEIES